MTTRRLIPSPEQCGDYYTDGRGFRAWDTRRANRFLEVVRQLRADGSPAKYSTETLLGLARELSDYLIRSITPTTALPRSYAIVLDRLGDASLSYNDVLLNPSFFDDLPAREVLERLAADIGTGWLDELADHLGNGHEFTEFWSKSGGGTKC